MDELSKMHEDMQIERGGRERGEMFERTRRIEDVHTSRKIKTWLFDGSIPQRLPFASQSRMAILWRSMFNILIISGTLEPLATTSDHIAEAGRWPNPYAETPHHHT
jgi:hypothetical protein